MHPTNDPRSRALGWAQVVVGHDVGDPDPAAGAQDVPRRSDVTQPASRSTRR